MDRSYRALRLAVRTAAINEAEPELRTQLQLAALTDPAILEKAVRLGTSLARTYPRDSLVRQACRLLNAVRDVG